MNGNVLVVPIGVVTPMFLIPVVAVLDTLRVAVMVVEFTTVKVPLARVTPPPSPVNPVAPVKFAPVMVTGTASVPVAGCVAEFGLIEVSVAPSTVNGTVLLVPPAVVMLTVLAVSAAVAEMVKVASAVVGVRTVKPLNVTPPPEIVTPVAPVRFVPVKVTSTTVPRTPVGGAIEVNVGAGGTTTVKVTALLVLPSYVVTFTFLAVALAKGMIARVAVTSPSRQLLGARSPSTLSGAMTSPESFAHSSSTACAVSKPASSKPGRVATASMPASSFSTNSMSLTGAL